MTIILDTNVLPRWGSLNAPHLAVVLAVAKTTGEEVVIPRLVLEESVSARRRAAEAVFEALSSAHRRASQYSDVVTTYVPSSDEVADEWRNHLEETFTIADTPGSAAIDALLREAHRIPPAREGRGGRDAAIWLTALHYFSQKPGRAFFVSENTNDFGDSKNPGILHPHLVAESSGIGHGELVYCKSVDDLIDYLATRIETEIDSDSIFSSPKFLEAVRAVVDLEMIPRLTVRKLDGGGVVAGDVYVTSPVLMDDVRSNQARLYSIDQSMYALVGFSVRLAFSVGVMSRSRKQFRELLLALSSKIEARAWIQLESSSLSVEKVEISRIDRVHIDSEDLDYSVFYGRASV